MGPGSNLKEEPISRKADGLFKLPLLFFFARFAALRETAVAFQLYYSNFTLKGI